MLEDFVKVEAGDDKRLQEAFGADIEKNSITLAEIRVIVRDADGAVVSGLACGARGQHFFAGECLLGVDGYRQLLDDLAQIVSEDHALQDRVRRMEKAIVERLAEGRR
jgi:hypothetical protein